MADPPSLFPEYMEQATTQFIGSGVIEQIAVIQDTSLVVEVDTQPINVLLLDEQANVSQIEVVVQEQPIEVTPVSTIKVKDC